MLAIIVWNNYVGILFGTRPLSGQKYLGTRSSPGVQLLPLLAPQYTVAKPARMNTTQNDNQKLSRVIKKVWERGFEAHTQEETLPQHLDVDLTSVATVHIGKSAV